MIVGVCDNDCMNINILVFDSRGNQVASDTTVDDTPVVVIEPEKTAEYRVEISMENCTAEPCFYGIGVFGK